MNERTLLEMAERNGWKQWLQEPITIFYVQRTGTSCLIVFLLVLCSNSSQYQHFLFYVISCCILFQISRSDPVEELTVLLACSMNYCSIWNISYKYCFYSKAVAGGLNPFWILYCPADLLVFDFLLKKMFLSVEQSQSPVLILQPHLPWTQLDSGSHCPAKSTAWERWLWSRKKIVFTFVWDRDTGITCIWKPLPAKLE